MASPAQLRQSALRDSKRARANPPASSPQLGKILDHAVAHVIEQFGRIDIAIANAGILSRGSTLRSMPAASIDNLFAVNITGVVNTVTATIDQIIANQGQIVLISSVFAFLNGMGAIPYAMSKAAVEALGPEARTPTDVVEFQCLQPGMWAGAERHTGGDQQSA